MKLNPKAISAALVLCLALLTTFQQWTKPESSTSTQDREAVQNALDKYIEGMLSSDADIIPLSSDVVFVEPDGTNKTTIKGIDKVAPFLERQNIEDIHVHQTIIDGTYGCELTDYYWKDGTKMPIALCLQVVDEKITEIRPYFDRTLFKDE